MTDAGNTPRSPAYLRRRGKKLFRSIVENFELSEGELVLLVEAARLADTCEAIEKELRGAPFTVAGSRGQEVANPLRGELRAERALLVKVLATLGLELQEDWDNLTAAQRARKAARSRWDKRGGKR